MQPWPPSTFSPFAHANVGRPRRGDAGGLCVDCTEFPSDAIAPYDRRVLAARSGFRGGWDPPLLRLGDAAPASISGRNSRRLSWCCSCRASGCCAPVVWNEFIRARSWHRICGRQCALVLRRIRHRVSRVLSWFVVVGAFGLISAVSTYALSRVVRLGSLPRLPRKGSAMVAVGVAIAWVACVSATLAGVTWWIALVVMVVVLWIGTVIASLWYRRHS